MATRAIVTCRRKVQDGTATCLEKTAPCRKSCATNYASAEKFVARYIPLRRVYCALAGFGIGVAALLALIGLAVPPSLEAGLLADIRSSVIKRGEIPLATALTDGAIVGEKCTRVTKR